MQFQRSIRWQPDQVFAHEINLIGLSRCRYAQWIRQRAFGRQLRGSFHLRPSPEGKIPDHRGDGRNLDSEPTGFSTRNRLIDQVPARSIQGSQRLERGTILRTLNGRGSLHVNPSPIHNMWFFEVHQNPFITVRSGMPTGVEIAVQQIGQFRRVGAQGNHGLGNGVTSGHRKSMHRHIRIEFSFARWFRKFSGEILRPLDDGFGTDHHPT